MTRIWNVLLLLALGRLFIDGQLGGEYETMVGNPNRYPKLICNFVDFEPKSMPIVKIRGRVPLSDASNKIRIYNGFRRHFRTSILWSRAGTWG
ncbi:hypothetical protein BD779DRAFT_1544853, partial [Infundibulicybe gibba]